jgi:hypothetical protein
MIAALVLFAVIIVAWFTAKDLWNLFGAPAIS